MGEENPKFCSNCGNPLDKNSKFCKECGTQISKSKEIESNENINNEKENIQEEKIEPQNENNENNTSINDAKEVIGRYHKSSIIAVILSLFLACLGQFYNGQILKGIVFLIIWIILFYIFPILLLLFAVYVCYDAYINAKRINENNGNYFYTQGA